MDPKKTYYPSKQFEKELVDMAKLMQDKDWDFPGDAIVQLVADAEAQHVERAAHEAARAMFRDDKVVTAELDRFCRLSSGKPRKAQSEAA